MSLKGTQTEKNILTAFSGESQARNRYTYFSKQAKKEGFVQIADIFEETANQEKEHAKRLFKLLEGGEVEITGAFPAGVIGSTLENLKEAAGGSAVGQFGCPQDRVDPFFESFGGLVGSTFKLRQPDIPTLEIWFVRVFNGKCTDGNRCPIKP